MAVAVKTPSGTPSTASQMTPALVSLVGVVYMLACLGIVFKLIPDLWWSAWESLGLGKAPFVGGSLLLLGVVAVASLLLILGNKLLGPAPAPGVKAGIVMGFLGLVLAVLLAKWASLWLEHWSYTTRLIPPSTGLIASAIVAGVLLIGWLFLLTRPQTHERLVKLEEGGWFTVAGYKSNQGQRVRRATLMGILLLAGSGVYTLINHNTLGRTSPNWSLSLPFSGKVGLESYGDALDVIAKQSSDTSSEVRIVWGGASKFTSGQVVPFAAYRDAVEESLKAQGASSLASNATPPAYLLAVGQKVLDPKMSQILNGNQLGKSVSRRLEGQYNQTAYEGLGLLMPTFVAELTAANLAAGNREPIVDPVLNLPAAVLLVDRYVLRDVNDDMDPKKNVKIVLRGDSTFKEGELRSKEEFDQEVNRLDKLVKDGADRVLPQSGTLRGASGTTSFASFVILPSVQYTVPLLLIAISMWLAWRIVNMPTFADFLIATEAEMNKVSWTTQKRLVQDTIVVLVTVVLMAVFLFGMDYTWKVVLSWKPIGVLHIPEKTDQDKNKSVDQKRW